MATSPQLFLGIDFGTSGCRAAIVNESGDKLFFQSVPLPKSICRDSNAVQNPKDWWKALEKLISDKLNSKLKSHVAAMAVNGTSSSLLLCDDKGEPLTPCLMYNDYRAKEEAKRIIDLVPKGFSAIKSANSALAKLLYLHQRCLNATYALHQADWLSNRLANNYGHSDRNNCLKMGYDPELNEWPGFIDELLTNKSLLPKVHQTGTVIGTIDTNIADQLGLPRDAKVTAGTTDTVAAAYAAGAAMPGDAVTSLGSTLAIKIVSESPVASENYGIYSHPYFGKWLVGGASNSGGAVLLEYFTLDEIKQLSTSINPDVDSGLNYYPLPRPGERFPIANPNQQPKLTPRPESDALFLQGMFEGIANIEAIAYARLRELGTNPIQRLISTGGGNLNPYWRRIRERKLGLQFIEPISNEAAYGTALFARDGYFSQPNQRN